MAHIGIMVLSDVAPMLLTLPEPPHGNLFLSSPKFPYESTKTINDRRKKKKKGLTRLKDGEDKGYTFDFFKTSHKCLCSATTETLKCLLYMMQRKMRYLDFVINYISVCKKKQKNRAPYILGH